MGKNELEITAYRNAGYALAACLTGKEFDSITLVPGVVDKPDVTMEGGWVNLGLLLMELSFSAAGEIHTGATVRETWFDTDVALLEECPGDLGRRMMTMTEQFTKGSCAGSGQSSRRSLRHFLPSIRSHTGKFATSFSILCLLHNRTKTRNQSWEPTLPCGRVPWQALKPLIVSGTRACRGLPETKRVRHSHVGADRESGQQGPHPKDECERDRASLHQIGAVGDPDTSRRK